MIAGQTEEEILEEGPSACARGIVITTITVRTACVATKDQALPRSQGAMVLGLRTMITVPIKLSKFTEEERNHLVISPPMTCAREIVTATTNVQGILSVFKGPVVTLYQAVQGMKALIMITARTNQNIAIVNIGVHIALWPKLSKTATVASQQIPQ